MQFRRYHLISFLILILSILMWLNLFVSAQDESPVSETLESAREAVLAQFGDSSALPSMSQEELIARGAYLAGIARCASCHTPRLAEYASTDDLSTEQVVTLSLRGNDALDFENKFMAGGRAFSLGPEGTLFAGNLTPDEATGIGAWTDEELEMALRLGVLPSGEMMHALMPYRSYVRWSALDMQALIAYLRSLPAIENEVEESLYLRDPFDGDAAEAFAALEYPSTSPEAVIDLGQYLVNDVMRCVGCHTPQDPETGRPDTTRFLAGGQAFEGAWGTVYGSNITPHATTGIGAWTDDDIANVFRLGIRIDGRNLILMPWQDYSTISDDDIVAVIAYLRSVDEVDNEIPLPAINEAFNQSTNE